MDMSEPRRRPEARQPSGLRRGRRERRRGGRVGPPRRRAGEGHLHLLERPHRSRRQGDGRAHRPASRARPASASSSSGCRGPNSTPSSRSRCPRARVPTWPSSTPWRSPTSRATACSRPSTTPPPAGKGFRGEDYLPATWQGGTFQGKRYSLPLDVPQHIMYVNVKVMKDAGLVGADGRPRVPASRDELVTMAKKITKADTFGFAIGTVNPGQLHVGLPQPALAERGQRLRARSQARGARPTRPRSRSPSSGSALPAPAQDRPARRTPTAATPSSRAASACGSPARGTSPGLREAKVDFVAVPVPRLFKQPVVWAMPHQYTFPKPKGAPIAAKRDAAWAHMRWMTDNVAEWTLKAGQVSASRKAARGPAHHRRPGPEGPAGPGAQLAGRAAHPEVGRGREPHPSGDRERSTTGRSRPRAAMEDLARQINALPD